MLLSAALIKPLQDGMDRRLGGPARVLDVLYFNSPEMLKRIALGYDSLLADVYWMRSIQYYGRIDEAERRPVRYGNLGTLLEVTTALDPRILAAYRFGAVFLGEPEPVGAGEPHAAVKLLEKGIRQFPDEWHLRFDQGFVYFWYLKDYRKAGEVWLSASKVPGAPDWLPGLAAMGMSKSGAVETARTLWQRQYEEADREDTRQKARKYLETMQVDELRWTLEFFVERYRRRFGSRPSALRGLVTAGYFKRIPVDPSGAPFVYDPSTGKVLLGPASKLVHLSMPYDYREAFEQRLLERFGPH